MTVKIKVLVVEDEPVIARLLERCVAGNRWLEPVGVAATREHAIEMARRVRPDLVLLDFGLSGAPDGGFGVWDALHRLPGVTADVIAVTGAKETTAVAKARGYGAFGYVVKPFTPAVINAKLADYAADHQRRRVLPDTLDQDHADLVIGRRSRAAALPHGVVKETLESFVTVLEAACEPLRAAGIAAQVGVARETANRYLTYLCDKGIAERIPEYGRAGHPAYLYTLAPVWTARTSARDNEDHAAQHRPDPDHARRQPRPPAGTP